MASLGDILKGTAGAAFRGTKAVAGGAAALAMSGNPDALAAGFMTAQASRAVGAVKSGVIGGVKGAFNRAFGGGSGGTGKSGSPTRTSGEQPLTEKTFQDFSDKLLAYTQSLVNMSNKELDAIQDQELRTREMLAEGTGRESIASRVAREKKKPEGMTLLKMLGLGALAIALAGGAGAAAGEGGEGGGIPFIIPPMFLPKPKPKPPAGRTPPRTTSPRGGRGPVPRAGGSVPRAGGPKVEKKPTGTQPKVGAPEKVNETAKTKVRNAAKKAVGGAFRRVLPGAGIAFGVLDAIEDFGKGDIVGGLIASGIAAGSFASLFPFLAPVAVPATVATVIADLTRDIMGAFPGELSKEETEKIVGEVVDEYVENFNKVRPSIVAEQLAVAEAGRQTGQRLGGRTRDMSPEQRRAAFEQQKIDRATYQERGGKTGTGVSFEKFAAGQQAVREAQTQADIDAAVEAEEGMGMEFRPRSEFPTGADTLSSERGNVEPVRTDTSDVTLQPSSSGMSKFRQRQEMLAASAEAEGGIDVVGATSVDLGSEELDVAGNDRSRAESKVDASGQENLRISRLLPNSMNADSTMNKAIGKALSTTA